CSDISYFFFQAEDGIRDFHVTGVQTCALPISVDVRIAEGRTRCRVVEGGVDRGTLELVGGGRHNLLNALAAASAARVLGAEWARSEERRVGKGCGSRASPEQSNTTSTAADTVA